MRRWSARLAVRTLAAMLADLPISAEELAALQAAGLGEIGAKLLRRIEHDRQGIAAETPVGEHVERMKLESHEEVR